MNKEMIKLKNSKNDNLSSVLEIKNETKDNAELYFYGDIVSSWLGAWDDTDQYPESIKKFLDNVKGKDLDIYINSGGGSVFAGMAIYNMLKRHKGFKTVYIDGLAASIASVIALAGDKVIIPSNAYFMIHKPWCNVYGNSNELREQAEILDKIEEGIINVYSENLSLDVNIEDIKNMLNNETWLTGEEAIKYFNMEISDNVNAVACLSEMYDKYLKVPKNINKNTKNYDIEKEKLLLELDLI
ncbi:TPA: Clp protease ClpP [Clostridioides difficile]|uniref:ATP-dependent Clp protease proteolytic subunit n=2 Tax=Clostridioides difficile TaxID=1496 RepID=A0AAN5VNQ4_CLODI|nr:Clp protease ClpP [Clostridioides difficile]EIS9655763.1 Clp protease ClpP [Clostridioides difficile]MBG0233301.1 Clp protease ClpP [Clostridioides difficile]MBZ1123086.1 Clp protease ClpP [Clostridioides difficile]MCI9979850.1 Clp protease ClpP [Clostridioides difficile]